MRQQESPARKHQERQGGPVICHQQIARQQENEDAPVSGGSGHPRQECDEKYSIMMLPRNRRGHGYGHSKQQNIYCSASNTLQVWNDESPQQQDGGKERGEPIDG